jgi:hypothetical protein
MYYCPKLPRRELKTKQGTIFLEDVYRGTISSWKEKVHVVAVNSTKYLLSTERKGFLLVGEIE